MASEWKVDGWTRKLSSNLSEILYTFSDKTIQIYVQKYAQSYARNNQVTIQFTYSTYMYGN
jgi:hypothetical protein